MAKDIAYTYIVECSDGTYYTGWTHDILGRIHKHNAGKGAKYTRSRLPVKLVHLEYFDSKVKAMKREYAIKQLSRKEKEMLIINNILKRNESLTLEEIIDKIEGI